MAPLDGVAAALLAVASLASATAAAPSAGRCTFTNQPAFPNYIWDPTCKPGMLGCQADGLHTECRFCGAGAYANISCGSSSCQFVNEPFVPYFWDPGCKLGMLGCWADGVHTQCRFCGRAPYTSVACPQGVSKPVVAACSFKNEPTVKYGWDPTCSVGMLGCFADGVHDKCRYCEEGPYAGIACGFRPSEKKCQFVNEPTVPYYWDPNCTVGQLGCLADGIHEECRFCAHRPFETIPCPGTEASPYKCTFPPRSEPQIPYYWEPACAMGKLGCWADGLHAQCRYCGSGVYSGIACPRSAAFPAGFSGTGGAGAQVAAASVGGPPPAAKQGALGGLAEEAGGATAAPAAVQAAAAPVPAPAMDQRAPGEVQVNGAAGGLPLTWGCIGAAALLWQCA